MFHWIWFQAIGNALCATGFGESIAGLLSENEVPNPLIERSIAAFVIVMLTLINFAGVKWVIRLQFLLLGILVLGAMDFGIGSFTHTNEGKKILKAIRFSLRKIQQQSNKHKALNKQDFLLVRNRFFLGFGPRKVCFLFNCSNWEKLVETNGENKIRGLVVWCHEKDTSLAKFLEIFKLNICMWRWI